MALPKKRSETGIPVGLLIIILGSLGVIGLVVSFFVAWAVIATFLRYLRTRGLEPFGWYRIVVGVVVLWALQR